MRTRTPTEWQVSGPNYFARCREIHMEPAMSVIDGPIPVPSQWVVEGWFMADLPITHFAGDAFDIGKYIPALRGKVIVPNAIKMREPIGKGWLPTKYYFEGHGRVTLVKARRRSGAANSGRPRRPRAGAGTR